MKDLSNGKLMWLKAWLFLGIGMASVGLLLLEHFEWKTALLVAMAVWAFCRAHYFAFYVIEHYVDGSFRYAGSIDFLLHRVRRQKMRAPTTKIKPLQRRRL